MNKTQTAPREIVIRLDRNGKRRAQEFSYRACRMFPLPIAEADLLIATGQAVKADRHPLTGEWL